MKKTKQKKPQKTSRPNIIGENRSVISTKIQEAAIISVNICAQKEGIV